MGCQPSKHKEKKQSSKQEETVSDPADTEQPPNEDDEAHQDPVIHYYEDKHPYNHGEADHIGPVDNDEQPPNHDHHDTSGPELEIHRRSMMSDYGSNSYYYVNHHVSYNNHFYGVNHSRKALGCGNANRDKSSGDDDQWMYAAADAVFGRPLPPF